MKRRIFATLLVAASMASTGVHAAMVEFLGSGIGPGSIAVNAYAKFDYTGSILTITLRNTSLDNNGQDVPGSTLTGLFWNSTQTLNSGTPTGSAIAGSSALASSIYNSSACAVPANCSGTNVNVGGEFGYQATALTGGANQGLASSGYLSTGMAGNLGNLNGANLQDPVSLDGINFGIITAAAGFNPNGGTGGLIDKPLVQDAVTFMFTGITTFSLSGISNVSFQYGTALAELNICGTKMGGTSCTGSSSGTTGSSSGTASVPEPGTLGLLAIAMLGVTSIRRRRIS